MEIVDALEKLGFSFWQVVFVVLLIYLRDEIKHLVSRVSALKIGDSEITLQKNADVVSELAQIQAELGDGASVRITQILEEKIDRKIVGALINLRKNTTYSWGDFKNRASDKFETFIRGGTFIRVQDDLNLLVSAGLIEFKQSRSHEAYDKDDVLKLTIQIKDSKIDNFIRQAEEY